MVHVQQALMYDVFAIQGKTWLSEAIQGCCLEASCSQCLPQAFKALRAAAAASSASAVSGSERSPPEGKGRKRQQQGHSQACWYSVEGGETTTVEWRAEGRVQGAEPQLDLVPCVW